MTMRILAFLLCLWAVPALAAQQGQGGPVRTVLTVADQKLDVDVTWLQADGVVLLKIVSAGPIAKEKRENVLEAAQKLLGGKAGGPNNKVTITETGKLIAGYRLTGWKKPFSADDLKGGALK